MRRSKRAAGGLAAAVAVTALLLVTHDATATTAGATPSAGGTSRTVTLVTGDRVTVVDGSAVAIEPGDGRDGIAFQSRQVDGQFSVIPGDVIGLLSAGQRHRDAPGPEQALARSGGASPAVRTTPAR